MSVAVVKPTMKHFAFRRGSLAAWHVRYLIFVGGKQMPGHFNLKEAKVHCRLLRCEMHLDMTDWR